MPVSRDRMSERPPDSLSADTARHFAISENVGTVIVVHELVRCGLTEHDPDQRNQEDANTGDPRNLDRASRHVGIDKSFGPIGQKKWVAFSTFPRPDVDCTVCFIFNLQSKSGRFGNLYVCSYSTGCSAAFRLRILCAYLQDNQIGRA